MGRPGPTTYPRSPGGSELYTNGYASSPHQNDKVSVRQVHLELFTGRDQFAQNVLSTHNLARYGHPLSAHGPGKGLAESDRRDAIRRECRLGLARCRGPAGAGN